MKKRMVFLLAVLMTLSVMGCGNSNETTAATTAASGSESSEGTSSESKTEYPKKAINMVVPYGAGGTTDVNARMFAAQLEKHLGQSIVIINQSGASGSIGSQYVLDQAADGYTILYSAETIGLFQTMQLSDINYSDFTPITVMVNDPKVVVVAKDSPYNTLEELLADIEANPGKIQMAHTGVGSSGHIQGLVFELFGYKLAMTPYDGGSDALLAVLGGQVAFTNSNYSTVAEYLVNGDLRALAAFSDERLAVLPDVPAFAEVIPEAKDYVALPFTPQSVQVAANTPEEVVEVIREAVQAALQEEEWVNFVKENNYDLLYEKYPEVSDMEAFFTEWSSKICYLLYDNGVANANPADFGIERP